ncbi:hypothetical protein [Micromonospora sp. NPDC004551]|uniref:hypothetical protein n=1 Tax=Micromonospora sp. NPDC004551 TaxID=3154284 RepID=UPI0033B68044
MAQITTTTTNATPLVWPSTSLIERHPKTGHLYVMVKSPTANQFDLWRSTNNGGTWSLLMSQVRANVQEISSIIIPVDGFVYWAFRTYESGQDRVYTQRMAVGSTLQWGSQVLIASATAASAGAVYQGLDITSATKSSGTIRMVAVAIGTTIGGKRGVTMVGETVDGNSNAVATTSIFGGTRQWLPETGTGRITPSLEIEHVGDNKTGSPAHLWITFGRTDVYVVKMAWNGSQWVGPTSPVKVTPAPLTPAQDYTAGRWDGQRFLIVAPDPATTDQVRVYERNRANSSTISRLTPAHPAGVIRTCSLGYNSVNGDLRVYAVGTTDPDLYFVDFIRATGTWTAWATVSTSDIIGTPPNNYSIRRATTGNAKYDVLTAHATPTPNTIVHTPQPLSYAPNPPAADTAAIGYPNGAAADVNAALNLAWLFSDPDANDTQSAWALQRQIGNGPLMFYRASDGTWQAAEVKNIGATPSVSLSRMVVGDAFNDRTVAGGWGGGWTTNPAPDASVTNGLAQTSQATVNALRHGYIDTGSANHAFFIDVTIPVVPTGAGLSVWALGRLTDISNYYAAQLTIGTTGAATIIIQKRVAGTLTAVGTSVAAGTHTAGATWRVGINVNGTTVKGKAWMPATQAEPNWQITQTDASLATGNNAGVAGRLETGNTNTLPVVFSHDNAAAALGGALDQPWAGPADAAHTYKVKVWDSADVASQYGPAFVVVPSVKVNPTLTSPTGGGTISTDQVTAVWSVAEQTAYRVTLAMNPGGFVVHDSGWRTGTDTSYTVPTRLADLSGWTLTVQTRNTAGLASNTVTANFTVDYLEPPTPTLVATPLPASGVISVAITNPAPSGGQPAVVDQDLWRRPVGDTSDGVRVAEGLLGGTTYGDWQAVSGVPYEYRVLARGLNGTSIFGAWTT